MWFCVTGARVILACRDLVRGNEAAEEVRKMSGNENVIFKKMDLASLRSVEQLASDVITTETRLDILINNAGTFINDIWRWIYFCIFETMFNKYSRMDSNKAMLWCLGIMCSTKRQTEDGFEMQFGVNHLGHFLLTNCLADVLIKSSPSRIINVSCAAHENGADSSLFLSCIKTFKFFFLTHYPLILSQY